MEGEEVFTYNCSLLDFPVLELAPFTSNKSFAIGKNVMIRYRSDDCVPIDLISRVISNYQDDNHMIEFKHLYVRDASHAATGRFLYWDDLCDRSVMPWLARYLLLNWGDIAESPEKECYIFHDPQDNGMIDEALTPDDVAIDINNERLQKRGLSHLCSRYHEIHKNILVRPRPVSALTYITRDYVITNNNKRKAEAEAEPEDADETADVEVLTV